MYRKQAVPIELASMHSNEFGYQLTCCVMVLSSTGMIHTNKFSIYFYVLIERYQIIIVFLCHFLFANSF